MKQGIHDKDNPLLSPGSNSSNTNTNTNVGSPSSVTSSGMMGPVASNIPNSSEIDGPTNGEQIIVGGLSGEVSGQQSWTPPSDEDEAASSPNITMSPNQDISSPHNPGPGTTFPYSMMHGHPGLSQHNSSMKVEISSPTNGSPGIMPSYPLSNGTLPSSHSISGEMPQVPPYVSPSSLPHYQGGMPHPSMMSASFWYSSGPDVDHNGVHQPQHIDHRGISDSGYLK